MLEIVWVFAYLCQVPFDASSLLNVKCEEVVGSIIVVTTNFMCMCSNNSLYKSLVQYSTTSLNIQMASASRQ